MKIFISVDIEGVTGVTSRPETVLGQEEHRKAARQMTLETLAAIEGALEAGASEIYVKDGHATGRNLDMSDFPKEVKLIRDWTGEPVSMMAGLDESFDGAVYIGYHAEAYSDGNPLAHTINSSMINSIRVNGAYASEFFLNAHRAAELKVPSIFIAGDRAICESAKEISRGIETVAVKEGRGGATISISPQLACDLIRAGVKRAVENRGQCRLDLADSYEVEMAYKDHAKAYRACFYPGVRRLDAKTVGFTASSMLELMTTRMFIM